LICHVKQTENTFNSNQKLIYICGFYSSLLVFD
jgi:hypothetical protein